ncbi:lipoyltransferase [Echria macrotheca]|uniref:Putative lipoate-protein ligase A n=1 Tax=Echria macrotheca TaxID=438768 RepID=A0AAJ0BBV2_9PEZI|nr:lipoyltransferase [Echria macrotheca]
MATRRPRPSRAGISCAAKLLIRSSHGQHHHSLFTTRPRVSTHGLLHPSHRRPFTTNLSKPIQIYRSPSTDPYLNLSIEHHLLQHTPPSSIILFLYTNRPSVVIGRNQNPWVEVNLSRLRQKPLPLTTPHHHPSSAPSPNEQQPTSLVRRRSGGGTVFHDTGNINWTVIVPPPIFTRTLHAEMITRSLIRLGIPTARVNERHDIVITPSSDQKDYKVSGSAYKLTRTRSLHHGTCLLSSPNLGQISGLLRSPAEAFIKARGVESVRSPIRNVGIDTERFIQGVVEEFKSMYPTDDDEEIVVVDEEIARQEGSIVKGMAELMSPDWIYGQTPQFTFSTHPTEDDPRPRPPLPEGIPREFSAHFTIRHGEIQTFSITGLRYTDDIDAASQDLALSQALVGQRIHHITDWRETLQSASSTPITDAQAVGGWLNTMFGLS